MKPRMGRPPKRPEQRQDAYVMVRMTQAEYAEIKQESERLQLSLSALLMTPWRKRKRKE